MMICNLEQMQNFADELAKTLSIGDVVCLRGDLGAGKTTFARFLINALCQQKVEVASPTFNVLLTYISPKATIWHYDLYRVNHENELEELAIDEALSTGISIIEWPDIAANFLTLNKVINIDIDFTNDAEDKRIVYFHSKN